MVKVDGHFVVLPVLFVMVQSKGLRFFGVKRFGLVGSAGLLV